MSPGAPVAEDEPGDVPSAGDGAELAPNNDANGFIRASFPAGVLVSFVSARLDELALLSGGNGRFAVSADRMDVGKCEAEDAEVIGRRADKVAVRTTESRIAARVEESAGRVVSNVIVDLSISIRNTQVAITHPRTVPTIPDNVTMIADVDPSLRTELDSSCIPEEDGRFGDKNAM